MSLARRPSPFSDILSMRDAMERLFDERLVRPIWMADRPSVPAIDLFTTPEAVIAKMALPGVKPEDVDITVTEDIVTITGSFEEEKESSEAGYVQKELSHGSFTRSFSVPTTVDVDAASASFTDGLLTLTLPKTEPVRPKHVTVKATKGTEA
ncbi:MAG: Hsp20/alpha crystallin family protein [Chloroflexota bacterium]|nr:Hsp20/alpha crystallin family protein [Chloroflexota bacterium]